ncbi:hypothetical protein KM043_000296 [Ampulex compressa]|nr:hypothetical protein KM043_000296 [Ampulex compressa]
MPVLAGQQPGHRCRESLAIRILVRDSRFPCLDSGTRLAVERRPVGVGTPPSLFWKRGPAPFAPFGPSSGLSLAPCRLSSSAYAASSSTSRDHPPATSSTSVQDDDPARAGARDFG